MTTTKKDVRQVKCPEQATCFLSDCRKLHFAFTPNFLLREPRRQAGQSAKLLFSVLYYSPNEIIDLLS